MTARLSMSTVQHPPTFGAPSPFEHYRTATTAVDDTNSASSRSFDATSNSSGSGPFRSESTVPSSASYGCKSEGETEDSSAFELRTSSFKLPLRLPRPVHLCASIVGNLDLDDEMKSIPLPYILDRLELDGPSLLQSVVDSHIRLPTPSTSAALPSSMAVNLPSSSNASILPDYVLAVSSKDAERTLILPVHGLVMATNCNALHQLSRTRLVQADNISGTQLPVVHISLPSSAAFSLLVPFFYTHSSHSLFSSLLPLRQQANLSQLDASASSTNKLLSDTPYVLASRLSVLEHNLLMQHVHLIHGIWQTIVALGCSGDILWRTMQMAWEILAGALALQESRKV